MYIQIRVNKPPKKSGFLAEDQPSSSSPLPFLNWLTTVRSVTTCQGAHSHSQGLIYSPEMELGVSPCGGGHVGLPTSLDPPGQLSGAPGAAQLLPSRHTRPSHGLRSHCPLAFTHAVRSGHSAWHSRPSVEWLLSHTMCSIGWHLLMNVPLIEHFLPTLGA